MIVTIRHDAGGDRDRTADERAPWTTPGAVEQLRRPSPAFPSRPSASVARSRELHPRTSGGDRRRARSDAQPLVYDILVWTDRRLILTELRRTACRCWAGAEGMEFLEPAELPPAARHAARWIDSWIRGAGGRVVLRWATFNRAGRSIPLADQSDATRCRLIASFSVGGGRRVRGESGFQQRKTQPREQLARSGGGGGLPLTPMRRNQRAEENPMQITHMVMIRVDDHISEPPDMSTSMCRAMRSPRRPSCGRLKRDQLLEYQA